MNSQRRVVASILHGAYGDVYEQALCLKHYSLTHPEIVLRLFVSTLTRYEAFRAVDLSFAASYDHWQAIPRYEDIDCFYQFQVMDAELQRDVIAQLPPAWSARIDQAINHLPWQYLRSNKLIPEKGKYSLTLSEHGDALFRQILAAHNLSEEDLSDHSVSFLWRYRGPTRDQAISSFGQAPQEILVKRYSAIFRRLIQENNCRLFVFGMKVLMDDANRERLDNKYPEFGLDVPQDRVVYFQGLSWPVEVEIASRATVCCGNASGFTEAIYLKRSGHMVLMDAPYHYLAKAAFHRMPLFRLDQPVNLLKASLLRSPDSYRRRIVSKL